MKTTTSPASSMTKLATKFTQTDEASSTASASTQDFGESKISFYGSGIYDDFDVMEKVVDHDPQITEVSENEDEAEKDVGPPTESHERSTEQTLATLGALHIDQGVAISTAPAVGWDNAVAEIDVPVPEDPVVEFIPFVLPSFKDRQYFLHYLMKTLEACFWDFSQEHLKRYIDNKWADVFFTPPTERYLLDGKDWAAFGQIELNIWARLFHQRSLHVRLGNNFHYDKETTRPILLDVEQLRHQTVHRRPISIGRVKSAMELPTQLNDVERQKQVNLVWAFVNDENDPSLSEEEKAKAKSLLQDAHRIITLPDLLVHITTLLEASCFKHALRVDPEILTNEDYTVPEEVELIYYRRAWEKRPEIQAPESQAQYKNQLRHALSLATNDIRNDGVHRTLRSGLNLMGSVRDRINWGAMLATCVGDPAMADEIREVGQKWVEENKDGVWGDQDEENKTETPEAEDNKVLDNGSWFLDNLNRSETETQEGKSKLDKTGRVIGVGGLTGNPEAEDNKVLDDNYSLFLARYNGGETRTQEAEIEEAEADESAWPLADDNGGKTETQESDADADECTLEEYLSAWPPEERPQEGEA